MQLLIYRLPFENKKLFVFYLLLNIRVKNKIKFYTAVEKNMSKNLKKIYTFEIMSVV